MYSSSFYNIFYVYFKYNNYIKILTMSQYSNCTNHFAEIRLEIVGSEEEVNNVKDFLKSAPDKNG